MYQKLNKRLKRRNIPQTNKKSYKTGEIYQTQEKERRKNKVPDKGNAAD